MSEVDIDYFTLHRLTEKAFKFDKSDKEEYRDKILNFISGDNPIEDILNFIEQDLTTRKIIFAASTADPKTALKPKGKMFRRTGADESVQEAILPPTEVSPEEFSRRLAMAQQASQKMILMGNFEDDEEDDDSDIDMDNEDIEAALKTEILNSKMLSGKLEKDE
jgi:hypothetical protein